MNANCWMGIGHVTRDPEVKVVGNNSKVAGFRLATNRSYKKGDEWVEKPMFIDCEAWSHNADKIERSVVKGSEVFIRGRLESDEWTSKENGERRSKHKIYVLEIQVGQGRAPVGAAVADGDNSEAIPSDLPF